MVDLRKLRIALNLTQSEMADILGCKQSNYSVLERTQRTLTEEQVDALRKAYGSDFLSDFEFEPTNSNINNNNINFGGSETGGNLSASNLQGIIDLFKESQRQTAEILKQNQMLIQLLTAKENGTVK